MKKKPHETNGQLNAAETSGASPPLAELELRVTTGIWRLKSAWVEIGLALGEIRESRAYQKVTANFEDYLALRPEWGFTRRHADRLIASAKVADAVNKTKLADWLPNVPNESIARALGKLPEEQQAAVYAKACENDANSAKGIEESAAVLFPKPTTDDFGISGSGDDEPEVAEPNDEEELDDFDSDPWVRDYIITIDCHAKDSAVVSAALAGFKPKANPLSTRFRIVHFDDLPRLFVALASIVEKLVTNIGVSVKAGAE